MKTLTKRKQAWVNKRQPDLILGNAINSSAPVAVRYYQSLHALIERMAEETEREIKALFDEPHAEEFFAQDASTAAQARILTNALTKKFNAMFVKKARPIAERFAGQADKASSAVVHSSIKQLSGGLSLPTASLTGDMRDIFSATVTENVALIKSISEKYLSGVQQAVMRSITTGRGLADLVPYLQKHKGVTQRRAHRIALDQNHKISMNLAKARLEKLNIPEYRWLHTGGADHPRKLHERMDGKIFRWDDPPVIDEDTGERGIPGQLINCACRAQPVIRFED